MLINKLLLCERPFEKKSKSQRNTIGLFLLFSLTVQFALSSIAYDFSEGFYLDVPYVHQVKNYCGPSVLAMVFRYWDHSGDQHDIADKFEPFPSKGLSGNQLKQIATASGFSAYSFKGKRSVLIEHIRKGRPLIVALDQSFPVLTNHYILVVGWISSSEEWIVHDPASGPYKRLSAKKFEDQWGKLENWTLLVLPRTEE